MKKNWYVMLVVCTGLATTFSSKSDDDSELKRLLKSYEEGLPGTSIVGRAPGIIGGIARGVQDKAGALAQAAGMASWAGRNAGVDTQLTDYVGAQARTVQAAAGLVNEGVYLYQDPVGWGVRKGANIAVNKTVDAIKNSFYADALSATASAAAASLASYAAPVTGALASYAGPGAGLVGSAAGLAGTAAGLATGLAGAVLVPMAANAVMSVAQNLVVSYADPMVRRAVKATLGYMPTFSGFKNYVTGLWTSKNLPKGQEIAVEEDGSEGERIKVYESEGKITREQDKLLKAIEDLSVK